MTVVVESEVRNQYPEASAADLKARIQEAVHKCQTQVDGTLDCVEFVWSLSQTGHT